MSPQSLLACNYKYIMTYNHKSNASYDCESLVLCVHKTRPTRLQWVVAHQHGVARAERDEEVGFAARAAKPSQLLNIAGLGRVKDRRLTPEIYFVRSLEGGTRPFIRRYTTTFP